MIKIIAVIAAIAMANLMASVLAKAVASLHIFLMSINGAKPALALQMRRPHIISQRAKNPRAMTYIIAKTMPSISNVFMVWILTPKLGCTVAAKASS